MKKNITILLFVFINTFCYSQECLSDHYLTKIKNKNSLLENKIKNVISNFTKNEKTTTNKSLSTQEIVGEEIVVIPVVFNIIHNGEPIGTGRNVGSDKIDELITILNQSYSGQYGGIDTRIRFCLAKQNSIGQVTTGVNRFFGNASYDMYDINNGFNLNTDTQIKQNISSGFPNNLFLNIWVADLTLNGFNNIRGYSSFPYFLEDNPLTPDEDESIYSKLDGVVLDYLQVGVTVRVPADNNSSNGSTAVHEIGHWLGLFHVFHDEDRIACNETSCETQGDMICDTDAVASSGIDNIAPGNCLGNNCNGLTTNVVQNFMDYQGPTRLNCRTKFTAGQKKRMRDILSFYRSSIYSQGTLFNLTACKPTSYGSGGGGCTEDSTLPVQRISVPYIYQDLSQFIGASIKFGERLEVNDKWLVTLYDTTGYIVTGSPKPPLYPLDYLLIYKREGCQYALHQKIELSLNSVQTVTDFGLQLNGNEIIISSSHKDEVYIYRLDESINTWNLAQQIKNDSSSEVGSSTYTIGRFLFILERNTAQNNIFRVYYKNDLGNYVFHQNIAVPGFSMPSLGKYIQSGNFKKGIVNFNSSTFTGSYDPFEILVSRFAGTSGTGFVMFELNSNNMWTLTTTVQPPGMPSNERTLDVELSKDFIYVLNSVKPDGSLNDTMYLYTYKITDRTGTNFPFQSIYSKQILINNTDVYSDVKLQVFNDQFLFVDNMKSQRMKLYYNSNFGLTSLPNWQKKDSKKITCAGSVIDSDDFEVFGNLLYYGYSGSTINIYNIADILKREGYDQTFIENSAFYNKKINLVSENFSTSGQKITIGESGPVQFNYDKEFIANTSIILMPGTTISNGSNVKLKINDIYGLCSSIIASKKTNDQLDFENELNIENDEISKSTNKAILYPNPNSGIFTLYLRTDSGKINYNIYDIKGNVIHSGSTDQAELDINLPNLPTGVYIVKLNGDNHNETIKFIKQ